MKKILFILILSVFSFLSKAQTVTPVTDTLAYLKKEVQLKKDLYIGKPLSTLLNDLKIQPVADRLFDMPGYLENPFKNSGITLVFDFRRYNIPVDAIEPLLTGGDLSQFNLKDLFPPKLSVEFAMPVDVPLADVTWGGSLFGREWTPAKQSFWGSKIVGDIKVSGIPADTIYSRIEIENMYEEETADTYDEYGDVYIRFYRDANCSIPYYLDNDIDNMIVKESYGALSNSWGDEIQYLVPGGQNEVSLGEKLLYSSYVSYDSSTEEYQFMSFVSRFTIYPLPKFTLPVRSLSGWISGGITD